VIFNKDEGMYVGSIELGNATSTIEVDTGAPYSLISQSFLNKIYSDRTIDISEIDSKVVPLRSFGSTIEKEYKVVSLRNVKMCDVNVNQMYFLVPTYISTSKILLGWDFLNACTYSSGRDNDFIITGIDLDFYTDFWDKLNLKPFEICNLTKD